MAVPAQEILARRWRATAESPGWPAVWRGAPDQTKHW